MQRRMDGSENFYRNWTEYKMGFGDPCGEFWIGNDNLYKLTSSNKYKLLIVLEDFDGATRCASYDTFSVGPPSSNYVLYIGDYRGTAGDSLRVHNNMPFSTLDSDHDMSWNSCAVKFAGAWWYRECHQSNLNGLYLRGHHTSYADGVNWNTFRGFNYSLKFTEMRVELI
ncbi:hypothetical protein HELRODRAFT_174042 [Helobdella robusta]|uniref:Fibrinogen C-terminal domain-containing protein n=1 Tax=Helobdella robusta TaxID=6412 RepID=T1F7I7_HELRO|nr:hypothetical protein HELRODRAFT_174042 [Helobdella robusta]ESO03149.1 hypothetical protein HELRODRAFT_174042 [Helobdella robusta]